MSYFIVIWWNHWILGFGELTISQISSGDCDKLISINCLSESFNWRAKFVSSALHTASTCNEGCALHWHIIGWVVFSFVVFVLASFSSQSNNKMVLLGNLTCKHCRKVYHMYHGIKNQLSQSDLDLLSYTWCWPCW